MAVTQRDYSRELVDAAKSVLIELARLLHEYRENIVVIGGWVPELLFSDHIGSVDVDLALNHTNLTETGYATIEKLLLSRGYERDERNPYVFHRSVAGGEHRLLVELDLLSGYYGGTGRGRRHQRVQGVMARKAPGCDLAFSLYEEIRIEGVLPDGAKAAATVRVASVVPFLVMKGFALQRGKEKDSWDVDFCVRRFPGGVDALVEEFQPHLGNSWVREGLKRIGAEFASVDHMGPRHVADFEEIEDPEARELRVRDAYERVSRLMARLGMPMS